MSFALPDNLRRRLEELLATFENLEALLLDPEVVTDHRQVRSVTKKKAALTPVVSRFRKLAALERERDELEQAMNSNDTELAALAQEELSSVQERGAQLVQEIQREFLTADDRAVGSIIVEIRAGVGGDEAAIWAGDLAQMYEGFAADQRWTVETMQLSPGDAGGFKNITLRLEGDAVWAQLGYEGGTHQIKRVPTTETQGRIHTSTATVAVLPEPEEIEVELNTNDVREMITTAQGPGGQNVNKVATAVHLIHEPTGIEVRMQDTKSQAQNREKAWRVLRARLFEQQKAEAEAERAEARSSMIGRANRAEKIRTYRYKENIVVDHRLDAGANSFNLGDVMAGNLTDLINALIEQDTAQRLAAL